MFKHSLRLFGRGVTEETCVVVGFARVCKRKSVVTFVILMPYVRHFYTYFNDLEILLFGKYTPSS